MKLKLHEISQSYQYYSDIHSNHSIVRNSSADPNLVLLHCKNKNNSNDNDIFIFQIGVFIGPSGSGKTTMAENIFGKPKINKWDENQSVISHFKNLKDATERLQAVHIPLAIAVNPFHMLSQEEQV